MLQPASNIVEGEVITDERRLLTVEPEKLATKPKNPRKKRSTHMSSNTNTSNKEKRVDWPHDRSKWGFPQQKWNTANKAVWLLYVAGQETNIKELTGSEIASVFNEHFRQAGCVLANNVNRDLGKLKTKTDRLVGEDSTKNPGAWYLTTAGDKYAQSLIAEALGQQNNSLDSDES